MITFFNKKMSQGSSGMWHKARAILKRIAGESVERWRGEGYLLRRSIFSKLYYFYCLHPHEPLQ